VDASISPVLWRLPVLGIELNGNAAQPIRKYMDRIFATRSFRESLTEAEREMRQ
jgi:RNA polymerase-associated protein